MSDDREKLVEEFTENARRFAEKLIRATEAADEDGDLVPGYDELEDWLAPADVAPLVGKSKRWVQLHIEKFVGTRRDDNGYFLIPKRSVLRYLLTRTEEVSP